MNVFTWSMPFVAEKIMEIFCQILNKEALEDDDKKEDVNVPDLNQRDKLERLKKNKGIMKNKLNFMSKMLKMQRILREENENIIKIKAVNNNKLP